MKDLEQEFKWAADTPRAFYRMLRAVQKVAASVSAPEILPITDVYLDSPAQTLGQKQIALRVRNTGGKWEATYKTKTELINGKAVRKEKTLPLPRVQNLTQALAFLEEKKEWDGLCLTNLQTLFVIKNKRTRRQLIFADGTRAELAFDNCALHVCGRVLLMKEIELELKSDSEETFAAAARALADKSGLPFAVLSKVKTAWTLYRALERK